MNDRKRDFRETLLDTEQVTPALKERYEKQMQAIFEKPVTGAYKWGYVAATIGGIGFMVLFGSLAILAPAEFPLYGRVGFGVGALFGLGWVILGVAVVRRGSENLMVHSRAAAGMAFSLPLILLTLFMVKAPDNIIGLRMILSGLVFLVMGIAFLLKDVTERSELKTREKLLEIEFRLEQLAEKLEEKGVGSP